MASRVVAVAAAIPPPSPVAARALNASSSSVLASVAGGRQQQSSSFVAAIMLVSIPCDAVLAGYGRARPHSLPRPLSLSSRHLRFLEMSARELLCLRQDCGAALGPQDQCIVEALHFIRDVFRSVLLDSFHVTVILNTDRSYDPDSDDFCERAVEGYGSSLRAACEDAEARALAELKERPVLDAEARGYGWTVACKLHLKGTYFTGDPHDFFRRHDALSEIGKFCPMEESEHDFLYGQDVSMSLFEQPAAKVLCECFERHSHYYDDLGSLLHQVRPVFKKHVHRVVQREISNMLDLMFV